MFTQVFVKYLYFVLGNVKANCKVGYKEVTQQLFCH